MYLMVAFVTHAHTHTQTVGLKKKEDRGRVGGVRQDKQSSKKHSSDPLSWWVAGSDAAA